MICYALLPGGSNVKKEATGVYWFAFLRNVEGGIANLSVVAEHQLVCVLIGVLCYCRSQWLRGEVFALNLTDILIFTTGVSTEPPLGFSTLDLRKSKHMHQFTSQCSSFEDFAFNMCFGMFNSAVFDCCMYINMIYHNRFGTKIYITLCHKTLTT